MIRSHCRKFRPFPQMGFRSFIREEAPARHYHRNGTGAINDAKPCDMEESIYKLITINRWESLNKMDYKLGSLRPVHGRLALNFLSWVIEQPGLELNHLTHIFSITTHILVRARMYDSAKSIMMKLSEMGICCHSVFDSLMNTYPLCKSNPSVFDLLIRAYVRQGIVENAVEIFHLMGLRGFNPSVYTCNMILGLMVKKKKSELVWSFFNEMLARRICPNVATFNVLINGLCVEGKLKKASYLLRKMEKSSYAPNVVSYNTLLNWLCKKGRYKAAFELIDGMASKGIEADICTYNMLIDDLCRNSKTAKGYMLLKKMRKKMIYPNEVTYNTLINGFVKEGKIEVATRVFDEMSVCELSPNSITYNSLINGQCDKGNFDEAFRLLDMMRAVELKPNEISYCALLNGLSQHGKFKLASMVIEKMQENGMAVSHIAYTTIIDGLCKRGLLNEALLIFNKMLENGEIPDMVTFSVLINGFCIRGEMKNAKELMCAMYKAGFSPNSVICSTLIYNYCKLGSVMEALKVYAVMNRSYLDVGTFTCNVLVSSLCKGGNIREAEDFMHHMRRIGVLPNSITYDCLINEYGSLGNGLKAFSLFDEMIELNQNPSFFTYTGLLKGLCRSGSLGLAKQFLGILHNIPFAVDTVVYNTIISEVCVFQHLNEAVDLFDEMVRYNVTPDTYTYSSLISALCKKGKVVAAFLLLEKGIERGTLCLNKVIYTSLVHGLFIAGQSKVGLFLYEEMVSRGYKPDTVTLNTVIYGLSRMGKMEKANDLVAKMRSPSLATFNILLYGNSKKKDLMACSALYKRVRANNFPDKLTCHSIVFGFCECNMVEVGVKFLKKVILEGTEVDRFIFDMLIAKCCESDMVERAFDLCTVMNSLGVSPSVNTYNAVFNGLIRISASKKAKDILFEMLQNGFVPQCNQFITLIKILCRSGDIKGAFRLKDEMAALGVSSPDVAESAMVRGLANCGMVDKAELVLSCMIRNKLVPTVATFTTLMNKYCKRDNLNLSEALQLKVLMERCGLKPDVVTYNVLISGICAGGDVVAAFELYEEMKRRGLWPNIATYCVLIEAILADTSYILKGEMLLEDLAERSLFKWKSYRGTEDLVHGLMIATQKLKFLRKKRREWDQL